MTATTTLPAQPRAWPRWPQSLFARLMLILLLGILAAQAMSYVLVMYERGLVGRDLMLDNLEKDITSSVAILDRVPAAERAAWLPLIDRKNYRYQLDGGITEQGSDNEIAARVSASIANAVDQRYKVTVNAITGDPKRVHIHLVLSDGAPLTINLWAAAMPISPLAAGAAAAAALAAGRLRLLRCAHRHAAAAPARQRRRRAGPRPQGHGPARRRPDRSGARLHCLQRDAAAHCRLPDGAHADPGGDFA
jgi:hypothetical protein